MIKRIISAVLSAGVICTALCSCTGGNTQTASESSTENSTVSKSSSVSQASAEGQRLLMKTFGELWMGTAYYIETTMTSEYDENVVGSSEGSHTSGGDGYTKKQYNYIIAVDAENDTAGLNMISADGTLSCVVKDNKIYTIDHATKTYTTEPYGYDAVKYGEQFTVNITLGMINKLTFVNTGSTTYGDEKVTFEKYKVDTSEADAGGAQLGETDVTYYFSDETGKPVAEIVKSSKGVTTFDIHTISGKIEVPEILEIPSGYTEAEK